MLAQLWERKEDNTLQCELCSHSCVISPGKAGKCGVRVNHKGEMATLVGDVVTAVNMDPIEKKPLYHFLPGSRIFSIGSAGCNFKCRFCQNSEIAHVNPHSTLTGRRLTPETLVRIAEENHSPSIAFTYNEPTVFFEQMYAVSGLAKARGLKTVLVSNGFMSNACLQSLSRRIDAANIDLKGYSENFYHKFCGGKLGPVLENLKLIKKMGWWLEVTTLVIPGINDSSEEIEGIAKFLFNELGSDTPWHLSAFHGAAQMLTHPPTPRALLERCAEIGEKTGLQYIYLGNINSSHGSNTFCPDCGELLIERHGYRTRKRFHGDECPKCKSRIPGIWKK